MNINRRDFLTGAAGLIGSSLVGAPIRSAVSAKEIFDSLSGFPSARDYIQDGLCVHMDGIESAGYGRAYTPQFISSAAVANTVRPVNLAEPDSYFEWDVRNGYPWNANAAEYTGIGWVQLQADYNNPRGCILRNSSKIQNCITGSKTVISVMSFVTDSNHASVPIIGYNHTDYANPILVTKGYWGNNANVVIGDTKYSIAYGSTGDSIWGKQDWTRNGPHDIPLIQLAVSVDVPNMILNSYINGEIQKILDISTWTSTEIEAEPIFGFGFNSGCRSNNFALRMYDRVLSDDEIAGEFEIDQMRFGL